MAVTLQLGMDFISPAWAGDWVVATARVQERTRRLIFMQADMRVHDRLVARSTAIFSAVAAPPADAPAPPA